ncbi:hypothetical protein PGT21_011955 [Puccinia graminis f. sp. tritici]|uniref:Uncharacterized protein n=1 Tax=Puccinia graminis f. sp. tritici TaxID=56615 RepID=A0A5B0QMV6_PUCGR|nr:hypothetical protein PGT21_011955 [Puccinia graminis f. sp. tritici]
MFTYQFLFIAVISQAARSALAISCYPKTLVNKAECHEAIKQIVYREDSRLGTESKHFGYEFKDCSIILRNPNGASPTRKQILDGYDKILNYCETAAGGDYLDSDTSIQLNIGNSGKTPETKPYNSFFPFLQETCGLNQNAGKIQQEDCNTAYKSIPMSVEGQFLNDKNRATDRIAKEYKSCYVTIYTSDGSVLDASVLDPIEHRLQATTDFIRSHSTKNHRTNGNIRPIFDKLVSKCGTQSGVVSIKDGARGKNGRVYMKIRNSRPCGEQVCN